MSLTSVSLPGWCSPEAVYEALGELLEVYSPPDWQRDGLCREYAGVDFFPGPGQTATAAKAVCGRCAVSAECLEYALSCGPRLVGIWAGTTMRERRHLGKIVSSGASSPDKSL